MTTDFRDLLARMTEIDEGAITPVGVKKGLNRQQQSANQLSAEFQPHKIKVLGSDKDPQHPMHGKAVGANEDAADLGRALTRSLGWPQTDTGTPRLSEVMATVEEDMLSRMRRDLNAYLDQLGDHPADDGQREPAHIRDIQQATRTDPGLIDRVKHKIEQGTEESQVVETMALPDGRILSIRGTPQAGFRIHRGAQQLNTNFETLDHARMAVELYRGYCRGRNQDQDYVEERR